MSDIAKAANELRDAEMWLAFCRDAIRESSEQLAAEVEWSNLDELTSAETIKVMRILSSIKREAEW